MRIVMQNQKHVCSVFSLFQLPCDCLAEKRGTSVQPKPKSTMRVLAKWSIVKGLGKKKKERQKVENFRMVVRTVVTVELYVCTMAKTILTPTKLRRSPT